MLARHESATARQATVATTLGGGEGAGEQHANGNGNGNGNIDSGSQNTENSKTGPLGLSKPRFMTSHHAPRKRLLNKLQALMTSPKRAIGHAERDGITSLAGGFKGRNKRDSFNEGNEPSKAYLQQLSSDLSVNSPPSASAGDFQRHHQHSSTSPTHSSIDDIVSPSSTASSSTTEPASPGIVPDSLPSSSQLRRQSVKATPVKGTDKLSSSPPKAGHNAYAGGPSLLQVPSSEQYDIDPTSTARPSPVARTSQLEEADGPAVPQAPVLLRPHLKLRIVTWNMHDSLPTGDLTELLGNPSASCTSTNDATKPNALDPDHPVQPLSSGFDAESPYHLVVVGGQEVPVGYGGWSGPNWTEIIQKWLSGTAEAPTVEQLQASKANVDLGPESTTPSQPLPPMSPTTAHRDFLDRQAAENAVLPDESIAPPSSDGNSPTPHANELGGDDGKQEILGDYLARQASSMRLHLPGANDGNSNATSPSMDRTDSSGTTTTSRSITTNKSAHDPQNGTESISSLEDPTAPTPSPTPGIAGEPNATATGPPPSPYVLVTKERLMGIYCSLWIHRSCAHLVQGSSTGTVTAGLLAGKLGNKGAACISLMIAETRMLFVCAHLAAHSDKSALRQANVRKIKEELVIDSFRDAIEPKKEQRLRRGFSISRTTKVREPLEKETNLIASTPSGPARRNSVEQDVTDQFDYTFWFGDLNFRLDISRLHADFLIKEKKIETALSFDQLTPLLKDQDGCFRGFHEAPIKFAPSYKYDVLKLKRAKTLYRSNTLTTATGPGISERRANKHMSAPPPSSATASRSNLTQDVLDEEEEELDGQSMNDRATVSSSRVSISSSYSGFDGRYEEQPEMDKETLANTNYNHRRSGGYFSTSIPSTPATDKVFEKAKSFFGLMRTRSISNAAQADTLSSSTASAKEETPSLRIQTANLNERDVESDLLSPQTAVEAGHGSRRPGSSLSGSVDSRNPSPLNSNFHWTDTDVQLQQSFKDEAGPSRERRQSLEAASTAHASYAHSTTPVSISISPATSPRPRLRSMRSSNTIFSMTSVGPGKSVSSMQDTSTREETTDQAVFDTSSKKRVQSWTDRILYKSTIEVIRDDHNPTEAEQPVQFASMAGSLISSLRGMKKTLREHHDHSNNNTSTLQHSLSAPQAIPQPTPLLPQRVSFQEIAGHEDVGRVSMYKTKNASESSLSASQQRINGRLNRLFRRRSSGCDRGGDLDADRQEPGHVHGTDAHTVTGDSLHGPKGRLMRSASSQSRRSKARLSRRVSVDTQTSPPVDFASRTLAKVDATPPITRTKPTRSYTSPLPSNGLGLVESELPPTLTLSKASLASTTELISPPLPTSSTATSALTVKGIFSSRPRSQSDMTLSRDVLPLPSSASLSRSGSAPDANSGGQVLSVGDNDDEEPSPSPKPDVLGPLSEAAHVDHKRGFGFPNPFARHHSHAGPLQPVEEASTMLPSGSPPAVKTGIQLSLSKTTPVSGSVENHSVQPSLGIRNWWNNRFKPHLFSFHHDSQQADALLLENAASDPPVPDVRVRTPDPVVLGPLRGEIHCISYDAVADLRRMEACSDHRPVVAVLAIGL